VCKCKDVDDAVDKRWTKNLDSPGMWMVFLVDVIEPALKVTEWVTYSQLHRSILSVDL